MSQSASSSEHDRTEPATPFKLSEARKQGQVAKSLDVNSLVMVSALLCALLFLGEKAWRRMAQFSEALFISASVAVEEKSLLNTLGSAASIYWGVLMAPIGFGVVAAILGNVVQTGPIFTFDPLKPKFERLNPVAGFKRVFNKRMFFEALKSILKLLILLAVGYMSFSGHWDELSSLSSKSAADQLIWFSGVATSFLFKCVLALLAIALIDLAFVRWQYARQMRMSRRDMKEEVKRREGDPLIRSKLRQLQRDNLQQSKSLSRVQDADVLITNPTHLSVALRYVRGEMSAPRVIAKGSERWAHDMRILAARHGIPIFERKALARTLFRHGMLDRPVPVDTFVDVARVYADLAEHRRARTNRAEARA